MIRIIVAMITTLGTFLLIGAHYERIIAKAKQTCHGYSVIEVDKGIDCNGDTIKLVKVSGFFERAPGGLPLIGEE